MVYHFNGAGKKKSKTKPSNLSLDIVHPHPLIKDWTKKIFFASTDQTHYPNSKQQLRFRSASLYLNFRFNQPKKPPFFFSGCCCSVAWSALVSSFALAGS